MLIHFGWECRLCIPFHCSSITMQCTAGSISETVGIHSILYSLSGNFWNPSNFYAVTYINHVLQILLQMRKSGLASFIFFTFLCCHGLLFPFPWEMYWGIKRKAMGGYSHFLIYLFSSFKIVVVFLFSWGMAVFIRWPKLDEVGS